MESDTIRVQTGTAEGIFCGEAEGVDFASGGNDLGSGFPENLLDFPVGSNPFGGTGSVFRIPMIVFAAAVVNEAECLGTEDVGIFLGSDGAGNLGDIDPVFDAVSGLCGV